MKMSERENLYCKVFMDFNGEISDADKLIAMLTKGSIVHSWGLIETQCAELDVRRNDDFKTPKELRSTDPANTFLFWKYYIDIEPKEDAERQMYISMISQLLLDLWGQSIDVVAACGFEDELPDKPQF